MARYLADSTIWAWAKRDAPLRAKLADRIGRDEIATCVPVALEVLHGARNCVEYEGDLARIFEPLVWLPLTETAAARALELQRSLAATTHGAHRLRAVDYLIVGCAAATGSDVVVWHLDRDLARLCEHAAQPHEGEPLVFGA